jgi:hypothetical protein
MIDDETFIVLNGYGRLMNAQHTGCFTGSGTYSAGKLRKVIGSPQSKECFFKSPLVNKIIPLGNKIHEGATIAGVTERDSAVHAACSLPYPLRFIQLPMEFPIVL